MKVLDKFWVAVLLLLTQGLSVWAADIKGIVLDKQKKEALSGAAVMIEKQGTVTDIDGKFVLERIKKGTYQLTIQYVAYKTATLSATTGGSELTIELEADRQTLDEVTVTGIRRNNTETALLAKAKESK